MDSEPVSLARTDIGKVGMPYLITALPELDSLRLDAVLRMFEEAQLDSLSVFREDGEVRSLSVPGGAERCRMTGPDSTQICLSSAALRPGRRKPSEPSRALPAPP
jgi:hypothetical protein